MTCPSCASSYGFDTRTAEKIYSDYRDHKKRKSFLDQLFV